MAWVIGIFVAIVFFYTVGRITSSNEQHAQSKPGGKRKAGVTVSTATGTVEYDRKREHYLPWSDEPYHHTHEFELFGTPAALGWNDGDDNVDVWCISRFSRGRPQTKVMNRYYYWISDRSWGDPPKGAARECLAEIKKVRKLK